jgi:Mn-containing catalase
MRSDTPRCPPFRLSRGNDVLPRERVAVQRASIALRPRFAGLLLEQFGGGNGELKAAVQYFVQAFTARQPYPDKYDLLMDIATEEFSHLEIVGATITMLLDGINGALRNAADRSDLMKLLQGRAAKEEYIHEALIQPQFLALSGGGPMLTNSQRDCALPDVLGGDRDDQANFPPGILQGDPRYTHTFFNMSNGPSAEVPWNTGQGPWGEGECWVYVADPLKHVIETNGLTSQEIVGNSRTDDDVEALNRKLGKQRSKEISSSVPSGENQWSAYPQERLQSPSRPR